MNLFRVGLITLDGTDMETPDRYHFHTYPIRDEVNGWLKLGYYIVYISEREIGYREDISERTLELTNQPSRLYMTREYPGDILSQKKAILDLCRSPVHNYPILFAVDTSPIARKMYWEAGVPAFPLR